MKIKIFLISLIISIMPAALFSQNENSESCSFEGDVGLAYVSTNKVYIGGGDSEVILPYLYADYCDFSARIDTLVYKMLPIGYGSLELTFRYDGNGNVTEAAKSYGIKDRDMPLLLGLGTYQITPYGLISFNLNANLSGDGGFMGEILYSLGGKLGPFNVYPSFGYKYLSEDYSNYYYGVSKEEAVYFESYKSRQAFLPRLGLFAIVDLPSDFKFIYSFTYYNFTTGIKYSPIISKSNVSTILLGIAKRF